MPEAHTPTAPRPGHQPRPGDGKAGAQPSGPNVPLPPTPAPSAPDAGLCGQPHTYKIASGEERTKPCIKAKGHTGPHSSRNQGPKVDIKVLSGIALEAEDVPGDELLDQITERERSAEQKKVDTDVAAAHAKWVAAGKPAGFNDAIKKNAASRYMVAPEHVAAIRTLLRRSESANSGVHVRIAPPKNHASGAKMIYFLAVDKTKRADKK